jgi:hypothetical protein
VLLPWKAIRKVTTIGFRIRGFFCEPYESILFGVSRSASPFNLTEPAHEEALFIRCQMGLPFEWEGLIDFARSGISRSQLSANVRQCRVVGVFHWLKSCADRFSTQSMQIPETNNSRIVRLSDQADADARHQISAVE